ncbi:hypothetical protein SBV42_03860 [Chlamydia crocodili]|uniref:Sperm tail-specific-like protein n=1 Tax=Chlamydia crocodili TaxID=2766982 RepID=A0ABX8CI97_9CHLA|nr:hypothetical protein [Chlamydia crocodili]QVE48897.1 hypothetical protein H9Q19_04230 [Chlamydia crocodili]
MMSSKRTSQLAMLSILLTFTHSVGYASAAVAPFEVSSVYSEDSLIALESKKSKKEQRIQKIQENRRARQEAKEAVEAKKNAKAAAKKKAKKSNKISFAFTEKLNQEQKARCQERKKQRVSFREQRRLKTEERKEQQRAFAQQIKQSVDYCCEELVQYGTGSLLTRGGKYSKRYHRSNNRDQNVIVSEQSVKTPPRLSAREKAKIRKRAGTIVRAAPNTETPRSLLKTMIVNREAKVSSEDKEAIQVVHDIKEGPVLPIFVRPDVKVVREDRNKLIQDLAREQRVAKRKSSREALEARVKESKIPRGGKITSTLRYDVEKAAAVKVRRNASVNPQVRAQKASNTRRDARNGQNQQESAQNVKPGSTDQQEQIASNTPTDDFYGVSSSAGNTNVNSYLNAKQYRCDSSETDWPCSSCVAKRRTHTSISVCTMVVTVIAMIVGAIIIANASDSTTTTGGGTTPPNPTPPNPQPTP